MLHPEIQAIVDDKHAAAGPPGHLVPIEIARIEHEREVAALGGPGPEVAEVRDVAAPGPAGPVPIRLVRPEGEGPLALVVYLHGGGWALGTLDGFEPVCRELANASGALVACVGYRLAPEHPFPAALEDGLAALSWLAENAGALGADPGRIGVAGDSAGGNLATVAARRLREEAGGVVRLRFQALVYPVCDSARDTASYRDMAEGFGLTAAGMERYWALYLDGADGSAPDASPLRASDLAGLPPAFVLTASHDVLRDEGEAYARALEAAGVPVRLRRYEGAVHGFFRWQARTRLAVEAVAEVGAALRAGLA